MRKNKTQSNNNQNVLNARNVFKKCDFKPKKILGQNFLVDREVIKDTLEAAKLEENDTAIEIGPGLGAITKELAKKAGKIIAVEKDKELVKILKEELKDFENIEIVRGDILKFDPKRYSLNAKRYKIVANLPFHIAAPVIRKFLESLIPPKLMILIVQKEVAERICASPPKMSILSVSVQLYSKAKIVRIIKKESFWPKPKVDSAILKIEPRNKKRLLHRGACVEQQRSAPHNDAISQVIAKGKSPEAISPDLFFKIVKAGFSQPRKQLKNNLKKIFGEETEKNLKEAKINPCCRAETLTVKEWIELAGSAKNGKIETQRN